MASSQWLVKPHSVALFSIASVIMLGAGIFVLGLYVASSTEARSLLESSVVLRVFGGLVGLLAAPAGICLLIGMLWYWAALDASPKFHKGLWFAFFLVTGFFGLAIYALVAYRRQVSSQIVARLS